MRIRWRSTRQVVALMLARRWPSVPPVHPGHGSRLVAKPSTTALNLMDALPEWFGGASWANWRVVLKALLALPMANDELALFQRLSGRTTPPAERVKEAWLIFGRRGGKSLIAAFLALFSAVSVRYQLAPGERGLVMVAAADRKQARVIFRYIGAFFDRIPALAPLIEKRTAEALHLKNGVSVEVHTASFRSVRGYTVVSFIGDEIAFWRDEASANPDTEILNAVRPATATVPESLILCISTPHRRSGALWQAYRDHWAKDADPVLVLKADSRTMNPLLPAALVTEAYERDPAVAASEYGTDGTIQFRTDLETFVGPDVVDACTAPGRTQLPPITGIPYVAFADPSGGGPDSMALAIAHPEGDGVVLDLVYEVRPRFSPEAAVAEFVERLRWYGVTWVLGDHYAGEWPRERFAKHGVTYEICRLTKSELYLGLLPLLNSGRAELLDDRRLRAQLLGLERHTTRSGRDSITHAPGQHDDLINAAAGALLLAAEVATTSADSFEMSPEERRQLRAMGFRPASDFDPLWWDEDLGMSMGDPDYPKW